jgi:pilus assembly protein Flp/PilA
MGRGAHKQQTVAVIVFSGTDELGEGKVYRLTRFATDERGASMVEYGLLVLLIAMVALLAVTLAGTELSQTYSEIGSNLADAGS